MPRAVLRPLLALLLVLALAPARAGQDDLLGGASSSGCGIIRSCAEPDPKPLGCVNNTIGNPCGVDSGPASQSAPAGQNVGAGNPLSLVSGNKHQKEVDLPALPGVLGLEIVRHYNSLAARARGAGPLGRGWRLSYDTALFALPGSLQIVQADGTRVIFSRDAAHPHRCASADPARGEVLVVPKRGGDEYVWVWPEGRRLYFDSAGRLVQISAPTGEFVALQRAPDGALVKVTDPQGRSLIVSYHGPQSGGLGRIAHLDSPVGRFSYHYDADGAERLVKVALPTHYDPAEKPHPFANRGTTTSSLAREYHYEDARHPGGLTGITVSGAGSDGVLVHQRIATWVYDEAGRAVRSVRGPLPPEGERGIDDVTLDFSRPGETRLTNSLGQQTRYLTQLVASERRLLEARGPGCASCGPTNVRYRYDAAGRLTATTTLDAAGRPLVSRQTEFDAASRPVKVARFDLTGKHARPIDWVRYEYAPPPAPLPAGRQADPQTFALPAPRPVLVARPSVVPGREHRWQLRYNDAGQLLSVTETGYAPPTEVGAEPTPITRTTSFRYTTVNGRSLLAEVDGPLPNGPRGEPSDSDITRFEWDGGGDFPRAVTRPGGFRSAFGHDGAGRLVTVTSDDAARRELTTVTYAGTGPIALAPESVVRTAWHLEAGQPLETSRLELKLLRVKHDALGRPTERLDPAGRLTRIGYDAGGRPAVTGDGSGHVGKLEFDTEGRLQRAGLYRPDGPDVPFRAAYFWHEAGGRLVGRLLPDGRLDTWAYDAAGQLAEHIDPDEIRTRLVHTAAGSLTLAETPDGWLRLKVDTAAPGDGTRVDDFRRVLRRASPDHGVREADHDEAGRLVRIRQADGSRIEYAYDAATRLVTASTYDASGGRVETIRRRYEGRRLAAVEDATQTVRYTHDALGRRVSETTRFANLDATFTVTTRFDPATGLVRARTLADGRVLRIERTTPEDGATARALVLQPAWAAALQDWVAEHLSPGFGETLGAWLPGEAVAHEIAIDPFDGLTGHTAGNGLATRRRFDTAGRLVALEIDGVEQLSYRYGTGPRIHAVLASARAASAAYRYRGFGQLDLAPEGTPAPIRIGAAPAQRDTLGRLLDDGHFRFAYTVAGQLDTVREAVIDRPRARYRYNGAGQRVAKTVLADGTERTTRFLWHESRRVAEIDADGRITAQYLYLADGPRAFPIAKLEAADSPDNPTGEARTLFIHTDHRGAPIAMTDAARDLVWRAEPTAWGAARPASAAGPQGPTPDGFGPAVLHLRLPGQYHDAETGFHDNGRRTYDPLTGRYLQPDPLGYPDGPDPYRYAGGDPINRIDPTGLYAEDVHYYMTYFLALMAGLEWNDARLIATAAQTIDDVNPYTDAFPSWAAGGNEDARRAYHFTQDGFDPPPGPGDIDVITYPATLYTPDYQLRRLQAWNNPQIQRLHGYAMNAPNCLKQQFYGEYLHALADVFGHRKANNDPYGNGGHALDGTHPDATYNHGVWQLNEQRTLEMERVVFEQLRRDWGTTAWHADGTPITFDELKPFLVEWNRITENNQKIAALNAKLSELAGVDVTLDIYDGDMGLACRLQFLRDAHLVNSEGQATSDARRDYPGAILDTLLSENGRCFH